MKQEIKERMERIRKGEVPEGYKKTKVGIIPDDWELEPLGNLFNFKNGVNAEAEKYGKGIKFVNIMEIINNNALSSKLVPGEVELSKKAIKENLVIKGDVLFNRTSETAEDIGLTSVYLDNAEVVFGGFVIRGREKKKVLHYEYKKYCFRFSYLRNQMRVRGQGVVRSNIGQKDLEKVMLPIPSTNEQQKIAEILSTWDKAIELKEKLIEEKKEFKRGLMQKLLAGDMRFCEFNDQWDEVKLKEFLEEKGIRNENNQVKTVLSVNNKRGFINQDEQFDKRVASADASNYKIVKNGQFAYNPSRINVGSIDLLKTFEEGILSPMYVVFETKKELNSDYLRYWLDTHEFKGRMKCFISGSVRNSLGFKDLCAMKFKYPKIEEQEKIVEFLKIVDKDILNIVDKLSQLKQQKRGLMQLLLTGIVRVEVD